MDIIVMTEEWFAKVPPISTNARKKLADIMPWIALIFGILGVLVSVAGLGVLTVLSPLLFLTGGFHVTINGLVGAIISLASSVLLLMSYSGLKARRYNGWKLAYWSGMLNVVSAVLSFSILSVLISLFGIYLLFQIKSSYK